MTVTPDYKWRELRGIEQAFYALEPLSRRERWNALLYLCKRLLPPLNPRPPGESQMREAVEGVLKDEPEYQCVDVRLLPPPSA